MDRGGHGESARAKFKTFCADISEKFLFKCAFHRICNLSARFPNVQSTNSPYMLSIFILQCLLGISAKFHAVCLFVCVPRGEWGRMRGAAVFDTRRRTAQHRRLRPS